MKHELTWTKGEHYAYTCLRCSQEWVKPPSSPCPGVPFYYWHTAPAHLQTYTQLRAKHLKPLDRKKPDGCLSMKREWLYLYDERQALPRRQCSERQRQTLRNAWLKAQEKYKCKRCGAVPASVADLHHNFGKDYCEDCWEQLKWEAEQQAHEDMLRSDSNEAIEWAQSMLARQDWVVLDTETTSLQGVAVEIAVIAPDGTVLFDSLVNPESEVTPGARAVHGISDEELAAALTLPQVWPDLQKALARRTLILTYNADFDEAVMARHAAHYQLATLPQEWSCVMKWYAQYFGDWSNYWGSYKWQPLPYAGHRAKDDALAALALIKRMAETTIDEGDETEDE